MGHTHAIRVTMPNCLLPTGQYPQNFPSVGHQVGDRRTFSHAIIRANFCLQNIALITDFRRVKNL